MGQEKKLKAGKGRKRERERGGEKGRGRERNFLTMFEYPFTEQSLPHLYDLGPCSVRGRLVQSPLDKPTPTATVLVGMQVDTVITVGSVAKEVRYAILHNVSIPRKSV